MSSLLERYSSADQQPGRVLVREPRFSEEQAESRYRRRRVLDVLLGVAVVVALIGLWQLASSAGWIDRRFYPSPSDVVSEGRAVMKDGRLWRHTRATLNTVIRGFIIGSVAGFVVGTLMGTLRIVRSALEFLLNALYVVPKLALLPIFLTIFGFGNGPKIALVVVTVFFFVWIETMETMASIPVGYLEAARSLNLNAWQTFRHMLLPYSLPQVFVGLRIGMSVAVLMSIAAEFVVGDSGLGYMIFNARTLLQIGITYVGIVWVAILGVILTSLVGLIGRRLTPWVARSTHGQ